MAEDFITTVEQQKRAEEERRRQLLDLELGEIKGRISDSQYEDLLERQRKYTPAETVSRNLGWHEIQRRAGEEGTDEAIQRAKQSLGPEGQKYLDSLRPRSGPANEVERAAIMNSDDYKRSDRMFNRQAGQARGREYEYVERIAGYEDRAATYDEARAMAVKQGVYDQGFDDNPFDNDVFRRKWADSRRMDKWQLDAHAKALKGQLEAFDQTRQKLTQNYQRMDPFARTQYKEMEKKISGLERARQAGRLRPLEYLRHMAALSDAAKTIKWKYHMKAPGGEVGDIWDKDGDGAFYQRQPDGTVKMVKMSPEYFNSKVQKLDEGLWLVPTIDKDGREVMKEIKGGAPGVDWKEKQEYIKELEKMEKDFINQYFEDGNEGSYEDAREWAHEEAKKRLGEYKSAADQYADPQAQNPTGDGTEFLRTKNEVERKKMFEQAQLDMKNRAMQRFAERKQQRKALIEAMEVPVKTIGKRREKFKDFEKSRIEAEHSEAMRAWSEQYAEQLNDWAMKKLKTQPGDPHPPKPEPPPKPQKGEYKTPQEKYDPIVKMLAKEAENDAELFGHLFHEQANKDPALRYLLDNPIPIDREKMNKWAGQLQDGYVYKYQAEDGEMRLAYKYGKRLLPVRFEPSFAPPEEALEERDTRSALERIFPKWMTEPMDQEKADSPEGQDRQRWGMF